MARRAGRGLRKPWPARCRLYAWTILCIGSGTIAIIDPYSRGSPQSGVSGKQHSEGPGPFSWRKQSTASLLHVTHGSPPPELPALSPMFRISGIEDFMVTHQLLASQSLTA